MTEFIKWKKTKRCIKRLKQTILKFHAAYKLAFYGTIYPTPPLGQDMTQGQFF